ncbi:hypothetical protein ACFSY7_15505 [Kurthia populi]|uniref:Phage protein n=1 Tax=Kurthia populi TaxID=1562132 RepID=A0ABW5Y4I9_9BACL
MSTLIIHDNEGYIISTRNGEPAPREPIGVPFIWVDIPEGKQLKITDGIGVDVSVTPHQVILEDIPPSEMELLKTENQQIKQSMAELAELILGGMQ